MVSLCGLPNKATSQEPWLLQINEHQTVYWSRLCNYSPLKVVNSQQRHFEIRRYKLIWQNASSLIELFLWFFSVSSCFWSVCFGLNNCVWFYCFETDSITTEVMQRGSESLSDVYTHISECDWPMSLSPRIWDQFLLLPPIQRKYLQWLKRPDFFFYQKKYDVSIKKNNEFILKFLFYLYCI